MVASLVYFGLGVQGGTEVSMQPIQAVRDAWIFLVFACWGGLANYVATIRKGQRRFSITELLGELVIAGFSGSLVYSLCKAYNLDDFFTVALTGIGGHFGSRTVFVLERYVTEKYLNVGKNSQDLIQ